MTPEAEERLCNAVEDIARNRERTAAEHPRLGDAIVESLDCLDQINSVLDGLVTVGRRIAYAAELTAEFYIETKIGRSLQSRTCQECGCSLVPNDALACPTCDTEIKPLTEALANLEVTDELRAAIELVGAAIMGENK